MKFNPEKNCEYGCPSSSCDHRPQTHDDFVQEQNLISDENFKTEAEIWKSLNSLARFEAWIDEQLEQLEDRFAEYVTKNSQRRSLSR